LEKPDNPFVLTPESIPNPMTTPLYAFLGGLHEANSETERAAIEKISGIRHARYGSFAACIGTAAARDVLDRCRGSSGSTLGLVVSGGPSNLETAWKFCEKFVQAGPALVNPLMFSNTLFSGAASTIAAAIGAHGFSLTVGTDAFASAQALCIASLFTSAGYSDSTIVTALCNGGPVIARCEEAAGFSTHATDAAIALGLSHEPQQGWDFKILSLSVGTDLRNASSAMGEKRKLTASWSLRWADDHVAAPRSLRVDRYGGAAVVVALPEILELARQESDRSRQWTLRIRGGHRVVELSCGLP